MNDRARIQDVAGRGLRSLRVADIVKQSHCKESELLVAGIQGLFNSLAGVRHFHTLGYYNGSSSSNICHSDLSKVPFNSELNSPHF